jgi:ubiquinone/menaquinone biosynthesis C-methylase UbiE
MDDSRDVWFFDRFAPLYDRLMAAPDVAAIHAGLGAAERDVEDVVDVAGGTGRGLHGLEFPDAVVLDASRPMLGEAATTGFRPVQGAAGRLPLPDDAVDAVTVVDALHMLQDVDGVLAEAARVLRPGGVLVVREIDPETSKGRALRAVEHTLGFTSTFLTPAEVETRMSAAGLDPSVPHPEWKYTAAGVAPAESAND